MSATFAITIAVIIIAVAIIVRTGWRPSKPNNFPWPWLVGLVVLVLVGWGIWAFVHRERPKKTDRTTTIYIPAPTPVLEFPTSGDGWATKEVGLKAYLDPMRTYTRPRGPARYELAKDRSVYFDDDGPGIGANKEVWYEMPPGEYLVFPLKGDRIYFRWWQK